MVVSTCTVITFLYNIGTMSTFYTHDTTVAKILAYNYYKLIFFAIK